MRFILGLLIGVALGACIALLIANQPEGGEWRRSLRERMRRGADQGTEEL